MAKQTKKENKPSIENEVKCKDCIYSYNHTLDNLSFSTKLPMLTKCKFKEHYVLYDNIEQYCINSKLKK